jgi:hypothetical protein
MTVPRRPSFDLNEVIGLPVDEAKERFRADGYNWVVVETERPEGSPRTLEWAPNRVRLSVREDRVVAVDMG